MTCSWGAGPTDAVEPLACSRWRHTVRHLPRLTTVDHQAPPGTTVLARAASGSVEPK